MTMSRAAILPLVLSSVVLARAESPVTPLALAPEGRQPRVAVGRNGRVAVVYGAGKAVALRLSRDGGRSYEPASRVAEVTKLPLGMRMGPKVAFAGNTLVVTAVVDGGDLRAWRSADHGGTWTGPVTINGRAGAASEGLHGLAAAEDGTVHAVWLDMENGKAALLASRSTDGGATWTSNVVVYRSPDGTVCECCEPSVAVDGRRVHVQWRNWLAGARDLYVATSDDGGRRFGPARKLGSGTWPLRACPADGGGLATAGGALLTVWRREGRLYTAKLGEEEQPLAEGRQPVVALGPGGAFLAWQGKDGVVVQTPGAAVPSPLGPGAFPSLAARSGGRAPVVLAWERAGEGVMAAALR
jgi:hypothetical protein